MDVDELLQEALTAWEWKRVWAAEIERRLCDLDEGRTTTISHEEFLRRMRAALSQP